MTHFDKSPTLSASDPLAQASYVSHQKSHLSVDALPSPVRVGPSYYEKPEKILKRLEAPSN